MSFNDGSHQDTRATCPECEDRKVDVTVNHGNKSVCSYCWLSNWKDNELQRLIRN